MIVEFAFVAIFLFTLIAATFDFGLAWRSGLAVTEATRAGARTASGLSKNPTADFNALTGVRASLTSSGNIDNLELVVIYRAATSDGAVPSSCTSPPYSGTCIVLTGEQLRDLDAGDFSMVVPVDPADSPTGTGCIISNYTHRTTSWCPNTSASSRNNSITANGHYLGVYVRYRHDYLFPVMGESRTIERSTVMRLEPPPL